MFFFRVQTNFLKKEFRALISNSTLKSNNFPKLLTNVPFLDEEGIIIGVKNINFENIQHPYNGSIVQKKDGNYIVVFRFDQLNKSSSPLHQIKQEIKEAFHSKKSFSTFLAVAELDQYFNPKTPAKIIDTKSSFSEDPRIFMFKDEYFLIYNDLMPFKTFWRSMKLGAIDLENAKLKYSLDLDQYISNIEKNWSPFIIQEDGKDFIALSYRLNPHKVIVVKDLQRKLFENKIYEQPPFVDNLQFSEIWSSLRGGTPALLVDGEYLAFFHGFFTEKEKNTHWYIMGAYTFEAKPPFRITRISKYPILFHGIYQTKIEHTAEYNKRVMYPGGFVIQNQNGKEIIQLLCGENDCSLKLISFDKEKLLKSLQVIDWQKSKD